MKISNVSVAVLFLFAMNSHAQASLPYNWTGFYVGLNGGAVQHEMNVTDVNAVAFSSTIQQTSNPNWTGGFQAGYRYQLNANQFSSVYGLEFSGEYSYQNFNEQYGSAFALYQINAKNELKNNYLLQGLGGIAMDRTFLFLAAGLAYTNLTASFTNLASIPFFNTLNMNKKEWGPAIGAGIEYAFTNHLSLRLKIDFVIPNAYQATDNTGNQFQISNKILLSTIGFNYK